MQVDFYILESEAEHERLRTACRLAEKAWQRGHRVFIHAGSREAATGIDDLLWTYRQDSFVPHALYGGRTGESTATPEPVLIGDGSSHPEELDVLINLGESVPPFAEHCVRVAEIVGAGDAGRRAGRDRYRQYRDRGVSIRQHNL